MTLLVCCHVCYFIWPSVCTASPFLWCCFIRKMCQVTFLGSLFVFIGTFARHFVAFCLVFPIFCPFLGSGQPPDPSCFSACTSQTFEFILSNVPTNIGTVFDILVKSNSLYRLHILRILATVDLHSRCPTLFHSEYISGQQYVFHACALVPADDEHMLHACAFTVQMATP